MVARFLEWLGRRRGPSIHANVDDEIRFHFDERIDALMAEGLTRDAAADQARSEFGDTHEVRRTLVTIDTRLASRRRWTAWRDILDQDVRYAIRALAATPAFTLLVVLTLALGIGANGAIFTLVDRLFLRPPDGVSDPNGLLRLYRPNFGFSKVGGVVPWFHYPGLRGMAAGLPADISVTAYGDGVVPIGRGDAPPKAHVAWTAPGYFSLLRPAAPAIGRYPTDAEASGEHRTALGVISYAQWRSRYGADPSVIGATIELARTPVTVIGVAAPDFHGIDLDAIDYWVTLGGCPNYPSWHDTTNLPMLHPLVRAPGHSKSQIDDVLTAAYRAGGDEKKLTIVTGPILAARRPTFWSTEIAISTKLVGVALVVLLVACANVANLLLARMVQRRGEIAIRLALGISRVRLIRLLLVESLLLSLAAAVVALFVAAWGGTTVRTLLLPAIHWDSALVGGRVLVFTFVVAIVTSLITGLPTALRASRIGLTPSLKTGIRDGGLQRSRLRTGLLVAEIALSLVLLVGAGAFIRSLVTAQSVPTGFDLSRLLVVDLRCDTDYGSCGQAEDTRLFNQMLPELRAHDGVDVAALSGNRLLSGGATPRLFLADGLAIPEIGEMRPEYQTITPDFFRTTGLTLLRGRDFDPGDRPGAPPVMIANEAMARALWPGQEAIGQCLHVNKATAPCTTVVGVAANANRHGLTDPDERRSPTYFVPLAQSTGEFAVPENALVRSADIRRTEALAGILRDDLRRMLPAGAYANVRPITDDFQAELRPWVLGSTLFSAFGALALLVASVGTYSALAYSVSRRTREMGIRLALGAPPLNLVRLVVRDGLIPVAAGIGAGVMLALATGRVIAALLYKTSAADPLVMTLAVAVLAVTATLGCLVPGLRATQVDPITVLRSE